MVPYNNVASAFEGRIDFLAVPKVNVYKNKDLLNYKNTENIQKISLRSIAESKY